MVERDRGHTLLVVLGGQMPAERAPKDISLESKVRYMIDCIESGHPSSREWIALNKFFRTLEGRGDARSKRLLDMISPIMAKYGQHGVPLKMEGDKT